MNRPTVLLLACDPGFSREIASHWPQDGSQGPEFIALDEKLSRDLHDSPYDLAITDAPSAQSMLAAAGKPAIVFSSRPGA
jgi:hypothetical protein